MNEYMALTSNADDLPSLYVNTTQPLHSLLSTASYRIRAVTQLLENLAMRGDITSDSVILSDFALLCCVPLRDGCDVLDVIARRMDAEPSGRKTGRLSGCLLRVMAGQHWSERDRMSDVSLWRGSLLPLGREAAPKRPAA